MTAWFRKANSQVGKAEAPLDPVAAAQKLRGFIAAKSKFIDASEITEETKLFSSGLLDSLAFVELVLFVEKEFHLKLADVTDVNMDALDSIDQILNPVLKRVGSS